MNVESSFELQVVATVRTSASRQEQSATPTFEGLLVLACGSSEQLREAGNLWYLSTVEYKARNTLPTYQSPEPLLQQTLGQSDGTCTSSLKLLRIPVRENVCNIGCRGAV